LKRPAEDEETFYIAKSKGFAGIQTALNAFKELAGLTQFLASGRGEGAGDCP